MIQVNSFCCSRVLVGHSSKTIFNPSIRGDNTHLTAGGGSCGVGGAADCRVGRSAVGLLFCGDDEVSAHLFLVSLLPSTVSNFDCKDRNASS